MTMLRQRGTWSRMTNVSDRDIVISLLRSAGHGNVLDRKVDLILSSKVKIDLEGKVVELELGIKDQSSTRFQQQRRQRQRRRWRPVEGNHVTDDDDDNVASYWDLLDSVGELGKLDKLVLYRCGSIPKTLNRLPELKCLELHFCHGNTMLQHQQILRLSNGTQGNHDIANYSLPYLKKLEIHGGIWDAQSIFWMKCMTSTSRNVFTYDMNNKKHSTEEKQMISQLEFVRFSFLQSDLRDAILDFLSPFKTGEFEEDNCSTTNSQGTNGATMIRNPTSKLKSLAWIHSGVTDQGLELLLQAVVLPYHPNLSSIDVSGNEIRSLQFLLELGDNDTHPLMANGHVKSSKSKNSYGSNNVENGLLLRQQYHNQTFYHPLRTLNLQHNPVIRHRIGHHREQQAFELLLRHCFPLLGSLTPSWEDWDTRIEYLLRINRGGRVLLGGNNMPPSSSSVLRLRTTDDGASTKKDQIMVTPATYATKRNKNTKVQIKRFKQNIHLSVWPLVLHRAYKTSTRGFLPPLENATAMYHLIRNGPALSEIFAAATRR